MPIRPEEVLFRRKNAPTRYEEDDVYFQERHLPSHLKLPDSDLLKAIHAYASDFYGSESLRRQGGGKSKDWESMDETALTAMGILLEEAAAEALGDSGHLAFLEQEGAQQDRSSMAWNGKRWVKSVVRSKRNRFDIGSETEESVLEEDLDEQESSNQAGSGVEAGPSTLPIIQRKGKGRWTIVND